MSKTHTISPTPAVAKVQPAATAANDQSVVPDTHEAVEGILIQRKLSVGQEDSAAEVEADTMADRVVKGSNNNFIQRKCTHCEEEEKETVQRKPLSSFIQRSADAGTTSANPATESAINNSRGNGSSLDGTTKSFMESQFNADFGSVRIHTNGEAIQMSRDLKAKAFTTGSDIFFNEGQYQPNSSEGKHLLAHELTHTLQQSATIQRKPEHQMTEERKKEIKVLYGNCLNNHQVLPSVGAVMHMHREMQLEDVLGRERSMLISQIKKDPEAEKVSCEFGVPGVIALYDTRNANVLLNPQCARDAIANHPEHYTHAALGKKRSETLPIAYLPFSGSTKLKPAKGGSEITLDGARQVRILGEDDTKKKFLVRVMTGSHQCEEGYIGKTGLVQATSASLDGIDKLVLVFFQDPERLGTDVAKINSGQARVDTTLLLEDGKKTIPVPRNTHMFHDLSSPAHTDTAYGMEVKFEKGPHQKGWVPKADVIADLEFRRGHRNFFINIGVDLAKSRGAIFVDVPGQKCSKQHLPIEYYTGSDIVNGILTAHDCTDKLIDEVHIIGHGGPHGMGAVGNIDQRHGMYVNQFQTTENDLPRLTVNDFATRTKTALANNVRIWLHACATADEFEEIGKKGPGYAQQFGEALVKVGGHTGARVGGLRDIGPANKGIRDKDKKPFVIFPGGKEEFFK